ncbi:MAG: alpha/beta hydrolase [Opitutaceae bacterium]|nr:alpha/beta hydrolase [Opitutaceae bacterium]
MRITIKIVLWLLGGALLACVAGWLALQFSPWPGVLLIRQVFDRGAERASAALARHVPPEVTERLNERYEAGSPDGKLDLYYPRALAGTDRRLTTVVWLHGGGFVSGRKEDIANYCRILAGRGFTVASVDYTIAPEARYPTPVRQANAALAWLVRNAPQLHVDPERLVLAGDSAGAHIAAQLTVAVSSPAYARQLGLTPAITARQQAGVLLYCGPYGVDGLNLDGPFGGFLKTVLWSYFGRKDFLADPLLAQFSVTRHVTAEFPPAFISAGNGDPLLPQSVALAEKLRSLGVKVDTLFFPADRRPALGHEYQFNLDDEAGRIALEKSVTFLSQL